jgi:hypothetical protein
VTVGGERLGFLGKTAFFGEAPMIELITQKVRVEASLIAHRSSSRRSGRSSAPHNQRQLC